MTVPTMLPLPRQEGSLPIMGYGTSPLRGGMNAAAVVAALKTGYRHIDTGRKYGTEEDVGAGMRASGVPRSEIFLTTKVSHEHLKPGDFAKSVDTSLTALKLDYIDLLLIHWPSPDIDLHETMPALAKAKQQGKARHIGVANFNIGLLDKAMEICPDLVAVQAEYHPYLDQSKLLAAVRRHKLAFIAYCPLGRGKLLNDPVLHEIGMAHGRTFAQVALRWLMQQNVAPIPFSGNPQRIADNFNVFDFELSDEEMTRISALKRPDGRVANPAGRVPGGWD